MSKKTTKQTENNSKDGTGESLPINTPLNVNGSNSLFKRHRVAGWIFFF